MKCVVILEVRASTRVEVDAASVEEAEAAAFKHADVGCCFHCAKVINVAGLGNVISVSEEC